MNAPFWPLPVVILAGGLATRLKPLTEKIPKSLVAVAGRPFLAHQLELLQREGIREVILCVGHLGEMIQQDFGDGAAYGVTIRYSFDGPKLLGTGGAIRQALPLLPEKFFVLYGDSYLPINYRAVAESFAASNKPALMTVYKNEEKWDSSNVWFEDGQIKLYSKKEKPPQMRHIDYGLTAFNRDIISTQPEGEPFDLADLLSSLSREGRLAGYEVHTRFYEIGSHSGLAELDALMSQQQTQLKP
jgi:NDP-sugar pyrophosphorylase family protein